ncbi:MAG: hypothetical protein AB2608_07940 [Candidatus Thiodiazotropha sp.]
MKTDQYFVLTIVIFISGVLFGTTFLTGYLEIKSEDFFPALVTLIAAFAGAWTAFHLQDQKEIRKEIEENVAHGNEVIAALIDRVNQLYAFRKKFIEDHRQNPYRWLEIRLPQYDMKPNIDIKISNLQFLWAKGNPNLTNMVGKENLSFSIVIDLLNTRTDYYRNNIIPAIDAMRIPPGTKVPYETIRDHLGETVVQNIILHTDNMIENIDDVIESHIKVSKELTKEMKSIFQKNQVKVIEIGDPIEENTTGNDDKKSP